MGITAWCLPTCCPLLLLRSISEAYILDISHNYFKPLIKFIFVRSVKNQYSNTSASLHGGTLALQPIVVSRSPGLDLAIRLLAASPVPRRCRGHGSEQVAGHACGPAKTVENSASRASRRLSLVQACKARLGGPAKLCQLTW